MRRNQLWMMAAGVSIGVSIGVLGGCNREAHSAPSSNDVQSAAAFELPQAAQHSLDDAQRLFEQKRAEYRKALDARMLGLDARLQDVKDRAARAGPDAKASAEKLAKTLSQKRKVVEQQLAEWKLVGADSWASFTYQLEHALDGLEQALDGVASKDK